MDVLDRLRTKAAIQVLNIIDLGKRMEKTLMYREENMVEYVTTLLGMSFLDSL